MGFGIGSSLKIRKCVLQGNGATVGGGIYSFGAGAWELDDCLVMGNLSGEGGGLFNTQGSNLVIRDTRFQQNVSQTAFSGAGAFWIQQATFELIRCTFEGNVSALNGGAAGGVIGFECSGFIEDCAFVSNTCGLSAAALAIFSPIVVTRCLFFDNHGTSPNGFGGAVQIDQATFVGCRFIDNSAGWGGAARIQNGATFINCAFTGNAAVGAGAILNSSVFQLNLVNCTIAGNSANQSSGGVLSNPSGGNLHVRNCLLWNNDIAGDTSQSAQVSGTGTMTFAHSCVQGWNGSLGGVGNIGTNPILLDADGVDNILGTLDDNLRLRPGSPCIDAADNLSVPPGVTVDLAGHARFVDDPSTPDTGPGAPPIVDMGAYEFNPACIADVSPTPDGDGAINIGDLLFVITWWGATGDHSADVTFDGNVNIADLLAVIAAWGSCG